MIFLAVSTGCRVHGGPEPELPCWWAELGVRTCGWALVWQAVGLQCSWSCCLPTELWGRDLGGPRGGASPLVGGAGSQGLWLQGPGDPGASPGTLVSRADPLPFGVQGWVMGLRGGLRGLKTACLLGGRWAVSLPGQLLGLRCPSTDAYGVRPG